MSITEEQEAEVSRMMLNFFSKQHHLQSHVDQLDPANPQNAWSFEDGTAKLRLRHVAIRTPLVIEITVGTDTRQSFQLNVEPIAVVDLFDTVEEAFEEAREIIEIAAKTIEQWGYTRDVIRFE